MRIDTLLRQKVSRLYQVYPACLALQLHVAVILAFLYAKSLACVVIICILFTSLYS